MNFTLPSTGGSPITYCTATSKPDGKTGKGSGSPIVVKNLTNGTPYSFTVTCTNKIGTGPASPSSSPVTPATVPGAPINVKAKVEPGIGTVTVTFNPPAQNGGSNITSYTVISPQDSSIKQTGTTNSITVMGLNSTKHYTFKVEATNGVGTGPASGISNSVKPN